MTLVLAAFGKALAIQAGMQADRETQEVSPHSNPIMNVDKAEAVRIVGRAPGGAGVTILEARAASRAGEEASRHAGMSVELAGSAAARVAQAKAKDRHRLVDVAAAAVKVAQAKAVGRHRPECAAAAADAGNPGPKAGGVRTVAVVKAVLVIPKAAVQEAKAADGAAGVKY